MISLIAVCALVHFTFVFLLLVVLLGTLLILRRLFLVSLLLRWLFSFIFSFLNPPWNIQQSELDLWMV